MKSNKLANFNVSAKMHIFVIISCLVIAIGIAAGTIFHFVSNGFFNYGGDYETYKSVSVEYEDIDFSGGGKEPVELIKDICSTAFGNAGVSAKASSFGDTSTGGKVVYKFMNSTDTEKLSAAVEAINAEIKKEVVSAGGIQFSYASVHEAETVLGGGLAMTRAAIVIATVIAAHFIYFAIRYNLTMALGAMLADVHNFALYVALIALCRVPVGSTIAAYAVLTVLMTVIGTSFLFDRIRKNSKSDDNKKLDAFGISDLSSRESFAINVIMPACLAAISLVLFIALVISSMSPLVALAPVVCSLVAFISCVYGTVFFVPSVYPRFKVLGDKAKAKSKAKVQAK